MAALGSRVNRGPSRRPRLAGRVSVFGVDARRGRGQTTARLGWRPGKPSGWMKRAGLNFDLRSRERAPSRKQGPVTILTGRSAFRNCSLLLVNTASAIAVTIVTGDRQSATAFGSCGAEPVRRPYSVVNAGESGHVVASQKSLWPLEAWPQPRYKGGEARLPRRCLLALGASRRGTPLIAVAGSAPLRPSAAYGVASRSFPRAHTVSPTRYLRCT
jgi:hypothetical protein